MTMKLLPKMRCTSEPASPLDDLVDLLEGLHQLLVVVAPDLVAGYQVPVQVVQLRIPLAHVFAESLGKFSWERAQDYPYHSIQ